MLLWLAFAGSALRGDEADDALLRGGTPEALHQALIRAGSAGPPSAARRAAWLPRLRELSRHPAAHVRREALRLLGRLGDSASLESMKSGLGASDALDREAAAVALGGLAAAAAPARPELLVALQDANLRVRLAALHALAGLPREPATIAALASRAGDGSPEFRGGLAHALGSIGGEEAIEPLWALYGDPDPVVRRAAIEALSRVRQPRARELLPAALWDTDLLVQLAAVEGLYLRGDLASLALPIDRLADAARWRRLEAVRLLRRVTAQQFGFRDGEGVDNAAAIARWRKWHAAKAPVDPGRRVTLLLAALKSPSAAVREQAGKQLIALRDPRLVARLVAAHQGERSAEARGYILRALIATGGAQTTALCRKLLASGETPARRLAAEALARFAQRDTLGDLLRALEDADETVRRQAALGLGRIGDRGAIAALAGRLALDPSWRVRQAAIGALLAIDPREGPPHVVAALKDSRPEVRELVARALAASPDPRFAAALAAALSDPSAPVRGHVARALAHCATAAEAPALQAALSLKDPETRSFVVAALSHIGPPHGVTGLLQALRDPDAAVLRAAAGALGRHRVVAALPQLCGLLAAADPAVRIAAAGALGRLDDARAVEPLWRAAQDGPVGPASAALRALGRIGDRTALDRLVLAARRLVDEKLLLLVLELIVERGEPAGSPALVALARNKSIALRAAAFRALSRLGAGAAAVAALRAGLVDPSPAVARAVHETITALAPPGLEPALAGELQRAPEPSARLARALAAYRTEAAFAALSQALARRRDKGDARWLIEAIGRTRDPRAVALLERELGHPDVARRKAGVAALAELPGEAAVTSLARALRDPDARIRLLAAREIAQQRHPAAEAPLFALIERERLPGVLQSALLSLASSCAEVYGARLAGWLDPRQPLLVLHAAWALGRSGDARAPALLRKLAAGGQLPASRRRYLCTALGFCRAPGALEGLVERLEDADHGVRQAAVHALGLLGDPRGAERVVRLLGDPRPALRSAAALALGRLGRSPGAADALRRLLDDASRQVEIAATASLLRLGQRAPLDPLIEGLSPAHPLSLRVECALLLASHPLPAACPALRRGLLAGGDELLAQACARALARQGDRGAVPLLRAALGGREALTEGAAADALLQLGVVEERVTTTFLRCAPFLIGRLSGADPVASELAYDLLLRRTGQRLAYDPYAPAADRRAATARWRAWWEHPGTWRYDPKTGYFTRPDD